MHVLLLEDQAAMRQVLAKALERSGWTVSQAATVEGALECMALRGPHVIVADRHLAGGEDGHAFAAEVFVEAGPVAVIYISASEAALAARTPRQGEWLLAKPFMPADLVKAVETAIQHFPAAEGPIG